MLLEMRYSRDFLLSLQPYAARLPPEVFAKVKRIPNFDKPKRKPQSKSVLKPQGDGVQLQIRDILNKISPEKYEKLKGQFIRMTRFREAASQELFQKALLEFNYAHLYACLVRDVNEKDGEFRKTIIRHCQKEFGEGEMDEDRKFQKKGLVMFLGHLCLEKMVSGSVLREMINRLLAQKNVEMLFWLMQVVGKHVPTPLWQHVVQTARRFKQEMPSRLRFMIMDLEDLPKKWE